MGWREAFLTRLGPGGFSGMLLGDWLDVLAKNRYSVDLPHWGRALAITAGSMNNSLVRRIENFRYGRAIDEAQCAPPVFVLGIWRSGTTHLHNLLTTDKRFGYPNFYQVNFPHTFLCTEQINGRLIGLMVPKTRPFDNVALGVNEPQEDENALCILTQLSFLMTLALPRNAPYYDRYLTFHDVPESEIKRWKAALLWFVKKLSFKHGGRTLILKSPGHTSRIKMILDLFPNAKFVHIHRHPYAVFVSSRHAVQKASPWWTLQRPNQPEGLDDTTIRQAREVYDAYFAQKDLIPASQFCDVAYEDLERDPLGQMRRIYEALALPDFNVVAPELARYLRSLSGYQKNVFPELPAELKSKIVAGCRRCFDEWGYAM